ncbi:hypothetical protein BDY24DRAFT_393312 [Mrakia frigida]|uniref:uncharacterized protein n=1 Tax=Mrakia frigida TaxID=29902 RepID=UPI003FCC0144
MPSSSRILRPIRRALGGVQPTTTSEAATSTSTPLFPNPETSSSSERIGVSSALQWGVIAACFLAVSALILMRYLRLRRQGGAVTFRQIFSFRRSYSSSLRTSSQRNNFSYPRSRPTAGSSSNFDSTEYPLPADMFLPTLPQRAARAEGRRGAVGATIGPGGRRDVGDEEEEAGNELPAYETARKTGLPDYQEAQLENVQPSHPLSSPPLPPPPPSLLALGAVPATSPPLPPPPSLPSPSQPSPSLDQPRPLTPTSPETDLDAEEEERRARRG